MIFLAIALGVLWLTLKWEVIKVPTKRTFHLSPSLEVSTRNLGPLKLDLPATLITTDGSDPGPIFVGLASSELNQWACSWDGTICRETYATLTRLLRGIAAPDLRLARLIVAGIALPDAPKPEETPAQKARSKLNSAVDTVQTFHDFTAELSQKKDFWEDSDRGGVIREMLTTMKSKLRRYDWRP